jgi:hypothetical protein
MQLIESVPLLTNSKANGFVGVNLYCDDSGTFKGLPLNVRATDFAHCCGHSVQARVRLRAICDTSNVVPNALRQMLLLFLLCSSFHTSDCAQREWQRVA